MYMPEHERRVPICHLPPINETLLRGISVGTKTADREIRTLNLYFY